MLGKEEIAKRIAKEVKDGYYVNLGIGIPTLVANYVRTDISVEFQSENGVLGMGPFPLEGEEDADVINAGKQTITMLPGASLFDSAFSFGMIRSQKVDLTILGAMEVAENGAAMMLLIGALSILPIVIISLVKFQIKKEDFFRQITIRSLVMIILSVVFYFCELP